MRASAEQTVALRIVLVRSESASFSWVGWPVGFW